MLLLFLSDTPTLMSRKVGVWIRVSTEEQAKGESPTIHKERAFNYAAAKGWEVAEIYDLSGVSGKSVIEHPEAKRMMRDIRSKKISALIFSKIARLARNTREILEIADDLDKAGADLVSIEESFDTSTPGGRLVFTMIAAMAQAEREEISARVAASVPIRAKMGKALGGAAPFGYQWLDGKLIPDPEEAPIRKLMFDLYLEIQTLSGVAAELNKRGFRTRKGGTFQTSAVRRSLTDTTAKGVRIANYTKSRGDGCSWDLKPEEEWVRVPVEPIVEEEIWDRCNSLIENTRKQYLKLRTNRGKVKYLFSGVLFCGKCGGKQKLYPRTGEKMYVCQKCLERIPKEDLEKLFIKQASSFLVDEAKIMEVLEGQQSKWQEAKVLLDVSKQELTKVEKRIAGCLELFHADAIGAEEVKKQMKPLESQKDALLTSIEEETQKVNQHQADTAQVAQVISDGQALGDHWESYDFDKKRSIIESMVDRIVVKGKQVAFDLVYLNSVKFLPDGPHFTPTRGIFGSVLNGSQSYRPCQSEHCQVDLKGAENDLTSEKRIRNHVPAGTLARIRAVVNVAVLRGRLIGIGKKYLVLYWIVLIYTSRFPSSNIKISLLPKSEKARLRCENE